MNILKAAYNVIKKLLLLKTKVKNHIEERD